MKKKEEARTKSQASMRFTGHAELCVERKCIDKSDLDNDTYICTGKNTFILTNVNFNEQLFT